jgi:hypothetical protein
MIRDTVHRSAIAVVVALLSMSAALSSPVAADDGAVATETGDVLDVAGALVEDAAPLFDAGDSFIANVAGSEVELPADPAEPMVLDGAAGEIQVDLPAVAADVNEGVVDESGAVVFESPSSPVAFAAQATPDGGMQVLVVIDGPTAPSEYRFDMTVPAGAVLLPTTDGGAAVVGPDSTLVSLVAPAWAIDANGQHLPTHYRIDGTTLVQVVDHQGAAYPVVADPCWTCWGDLAATLVGIGTTVAGGIAVVTGAATCPVWCVAAGAVATGYGAVRWVQSNYKSCKGQKNVNPWREAYWGCR